MYHEDSNNEFKLPEIAVIIMAYGLRPTLATAVSSVQKQDIAAEVIVIHSGDGDPIKYFVDHGIKVRIARAQSRLFPGAARNAGIAATRAPIVSFLADDCVAEPGALRERLNEHNAGVRAVASALLCHRPNNPCALAAHLSLYWRRMPRVEPALALRYGVSYHRNLFKEYGYFRGDLETGEDTEFHRRLSGPDKPIWCPKVQTTHHGEEKVLKFLVSQFWRGRRMAAAEVALKMSNKQNVARNAIQRSYLSIRQGIKLVDANHVIFAWLSIPFIFIGNMSYALGAYTWKGVDT